jgi:hypothetical protein
LHRPRQRNIREQGLFKFDGGRYEGRIHAEIADEVAAQCASLTRAIKSRRWSTMS